MLLGALVTLLSASGSTCYSTECCWEHLLLFWVLLGAFVTLLLLEKDPEDELDNEFAELANRNKIKNTNPFRVVF